MKIQLLGTTDATGTVTGVTATNSAPSGATAGKSRNPSENAPNGNADREGVPPWADRCILAVKSTAGSGTMTVTIRMWGYSKDAGWCPMGTGADSTKGVINGGAALGETGTNTINHAEIVSGCSGFERFYAEVTAIGGTATAIAAWLIPLRAQEAH